MNFSKISFIIFLNLSLAISGFSQYYFNQIPADIAVTWLANGVVESPSNVQIFDSNVNSIGVFKDAENLGIGIESGIFLTTGKITGYPINQSAATFLSFDNLAGGDSSLYITMDSANIRNASRIQFDFVSIDDTLKIKYVFASEEYPEFVGSNTTDAFAIYLSGPKPSGGFYNVQNIALVPNNNTPVTVNTVSHLSAPQYYVSNAGGTAFRFDGYTLPLTAVAPLIPGEEYTLKIVIADVGDALFDSGVFIEADVQLDIMNPVAQFLIPPQDTLVCIQEIVDFSAQLIGGDTTNLSWYWELGNGATPLVANVQSPSGIVYDTQGQVVIKLIASNNYGSDTIQKSIQINSLPTANFNIVHVTEGSDGSITVLPQIGVPPFSAMWIFQGDTLEGLQINNLTEGEYNLILTDSMGCSSNYTTQINSFVSVDEYYNNNISIWPNPVKGDLNIRLTKTGQYTVKIIDLAGREMVKKSFKGYSHILMVNELKSGIYIVEVLSSEGENIIQKFIKE